MRYIGSTFEFVAVTFLFVGSITALPTCTPHTAHTSSLQDALEILRDDNLWERPMFRGAPKSKGFPVPLCKLDKVQVPLGEGTPKLTGAGSLELKLVVIGHGTQNYTCADSTANCKPVANGAHAQLYDASCFASYMPGILNWLPQLFLLKPRAILGDKLPKAGMHYFYPDAATAVFDVRGTKATAKKKGRFVGKKLENIPAPSNAYSGVAPNAFGAVDWLKLVPKDNVYTPSGEVFASNGYKAVYRVETAGGKPPATCEGRPKHFEVLYATQYWLYN